MFLITGASGFLGRTLLAHLLQHAKLPPEQVAVLVRHPARWREAAAHTPWAACPIVEGDLDDVSLWAPRAQALQITGVFHLAATVRHSRAAADVADTWRINVEGTKRIAQLCHTLQARCVFVSSSGTVGCHAYPDARPSEGADYAYEAVSRWPYYRSKIAAEQAARTTLAQAHQLVIVRPPILLGPGDTLFRSTSTVVRFLRGRVPFALAGGIAFVDVRDAAAAIAAAMQLPSPAAIYHLPGHAMSLQRYFATLARLAERKAPRFVLPQRLAMALSHGSKLWARCTGQAHAALEPVTVEMAHCFWDVSSVRAAADLGYRARPAEQTLADTIEDLRRRRPDCTARAA